MYNFSIDLIDGLDETQKLPNTPINDIPLYSSLDILINCLQENFVRALNIRQHPNEQSQFLAPSESELPMSPPEHLANRIEPQERKEKFFSKCFHNGELMHRVPTGAQEEINDAQFNIICNAIKNSSNLNTLWLSLTISLTEYQEKELVAAVAENPSITLVIIDGCISSTTITAMKEITKQRSELRINSEGAITSTNNIPEAIKHGQAKIQRLLQAERARNTTQETSEFTNMHLLQGFIAVLGVAAVATAFTLLHAAALNPIGIVLAAAGGAHNLWVNN